MKRILTLQALPPIGAERVGADARNAISSCSYVACGTCSTPSVDACSPPPPALVAL